MYIQHRLHQRTEEIRTLLLEEGASGYICGSMKTAKSKVYLLEILIDADWKEIKASRSIDALKAVAAYRRLYGSKSLVKMAHIDPHWPAGSI
jgi:sulfite reductase alpha subunit-like flavoprotein